MKRVAILTDEAHPRLTDDDRWLLPAFASLGVLAKPLIWSRDELQGFDAIVVRSPWDYHLRFNEFQEWLSAREEIGTRFVNELPLIRWNLHKEYLVDLARVHRDVIPTVHIPRGEWTRREQELDGRWPKVVIKPAVSATAFQTRRGDWPLSGEMEPWAQRLGEEHDLLVQPYREEVESRGELSIVAIGGEVSHVCLKRPKKGDFRVQSEFGGSVERVDADPQYQSMVTRFLETVRALAVAEDIASYARIDLLPGVQPGTWDLGELELIEPELGFQLEPRAASALAAHVTDLIE